MTPPIPARVTLWVLLPGVTPGVSRCEAAGELLLHRTGHLTLEIEDAAGEVRDYAVERLPGARFAVRLRRVDTGDVYEVRELAAGGRFQCDCGDASNRNRRVRPNGAAARPRGAPCKHEAVCPGLKAVAALLPLVPETLPPAPVATPSVVTGRRPFWEE